ncbi:hypothetical protein Tamer19_62120 [Cupriavidus sp. TA19]|nr:hypothetical protein Tamer19_62120 [Cupriavidus sp. TA19]
MGWSGPGILTGLPGIVLLLRGGMQDILGACRATCRRGANCECRAQLPVRFEGYPEAFSQAYVACRCVDWLAFFAAGHECKSRAKPDHDNARRHGAGARK